MEFIPAEQKSLLAFVVLLLFVGSGVIIALKKITAWKWWSAGYLVLLLAFSFFALSGLVARSFVPFGPLLFMGLILFSIGFSLSASGFELASKISLTTLVAFQGFRLPLELILHEWASRGTVPATMTWTGQNFDILSGIVAVGAAPFVGKSRNLAWVANIVGFVLVLNVIRVVLMSSPLPFAWPLERPILLIAYFPYALIGPICVGPALVGHLLTFRKLLGK